METCKVAGLDVVMAKMLKELPQRTVLMLTYLFNTVLRLQHIPKVWKIAKIILIPKPGKPLEDLKSHRSISLLPTISKLSEKLFLKRLSRITEKIKSFQITSLASGASTQQLIIEVLR